MKPPQLRASKSSGALMLGLFLCRIPLVGIKATPQPVAAK